MKFMVAVDGSQQALDGAKWLGALPLTAGDEVVVAAVAKGPAMIGAPDYVHTPHMRKAIEEAWTEARGQAREAAAEAVAALADAGCQVQALVRDGHPVDTLIRIADELNADMIAVGPRGKGMLEAILLGSVSEGLLQTMPTSVAVARAPFQAPTRVILAADGSPHSLAAARFLARFPLPPQAQIEVLHVISDSMGIYFAQADAEVAAQIVDAAVAELDAAGRSSSIRIRHGDAKREIITAAAEKEADLVVTGARGLGGFTGLLLGSVSRAVAKAAPCSVVVVGQRRGGGA